MPSYTDNDVETPDFKTREDGTFLCEVQKAVSSHDKNGDEVITLTFIDPATSEVIGMDRLNFGAQYRWIAHKRVKALGIQKKPDGIWDFTAQDLIGKQAIIVWHNKPGKDGRMFYNVDSKAIDTECGYKPAPNQGDSDIPF